MQLRRQRVTQSLTSRLSCRCGLGVAVVCRGLAPLQCQVAKRVARVGAQLGRPAAKSSLCQKSRRAGVLLVFDDVQRLDEG